MISLRFSTGALCIALASLALAGCDNSKEAETDPLDDIRGTPTPEQLKALEAKTSLASGTGTPSADGTFSASLTTILKGSYNDDKGNGFAYQLGRDGTAFSAFVGVLPATDVGTLPASGLASMSGVYQIYEVGKSEGVVRDYGAIATTKGRITIRADFDLGTLQGKDDNLNIDGTFKGKTLSGSAFFKKRPAALSGEVGGSRAVGVFHGTDDATTFVGGFVVDR